MTSDELDPPTRPIGGVAGRLRIVIGVVSVVAGLLAFALPSRTLLFLAVVVGVQLVVVGLMRAWAIGTSDLPSNIKLIGTVLAVLIVGAGVVCMLRPGTSLLVIALVVGIGWIADGVVELVASATGAAADRGYVLFTGLFTLAGGIAVIVFPRTSLTALAQVSGVILIIFGLVYLASGVSARRTGST